MEFLRNLRESLTGGNSIPKLIEKLKNADNVAISDTLLQYSGGGNREQFAASKKRLVAEKRAIGIMAPALGLAAPSLEGENIARPEGEKRRKAVLNYWNLTHPSNTLPLIGKTTAEYREVLNILLRGHWYTDEVREVLALEALHTEVENELWSADVDFDDSVLERTDFSTNYEMHAQYPGQAWVKNNNPSGITRGVSNDLKKARKEANVGFAKGSKRPSGEGGHYILFDSLGDGIKATEIALKRGNYTLYNRLQEWVGTAEGPAYARQVMQYAGLDDSKRLRFSDLNNKQLKKLVFAVIKKESPGLYAWLEKNNALIS